MFQWLKEEAGPSLWEMCLWLPRSPFPRLHLLSSAQSVDNPLCGFLEKPEFLVEGDGHHERDGRAVAA